LRSNLQALAPNTDIGVLEAVRAQCKIPKGDFLAEIKYQQKEPKIEEIMSRYHQDIGKIGGFSAQKVVAEKNQ